MPRRRIYTSPIPADATTRDRQNAQSDVERLGVVGGGRPIAESVRTNPDAVTIDGEYRGRYADILAHELEEMFSSPQIDHVPIYSVDDDGNWERGDVDGFYSLERATVNPADPRNEGKTHYGFETVSVRKGTRQDFWMAIATNTRQADHPFGNDLDEEVGVPAFASKVFWYDQSSGDRASASSTSTVEGKYADTEIYDLEDVDEFSDPAILYEIEFDQTGKVDLSLWDDRGHTDKLDDDGIPQWFKVYNPTHEPDGSFVLSNGIIRVRFVEGGEIKADRWDSDSESWSSVDLSEPSDTSLFDVDALEIGRATVEVRLMFDTGDEIYDLDARLSRGMEDVQFDIPKNQNDAVPTDVEDWLDPIASSTLLDPQASKTIVDRSEVRR